jgi:hypothetical protein
VPVAVSAVGVPSAHTASSSTTERLSVAVTPVGYPSSGPPSSTMAAASSSSAP